jgi:hypothetical protein
MMLRAICECCSKLGLTQPPVERTGAKIGARDGWKFTKFRVVLFSALNTIASVWTASDSLRVLEYRARAQELRDRAEQTGAPDIRSRFLDIAKQYEVLAADVERRLFRYLSSPALI